MWMQSSCHQFIVEDLRKLKLGHDFRCLASWPGPSLVPCSRVSRGRCPEAIAQAATSWRMTSPCHFSRPTKARLAAVSSWSKPRGAYPCCWRGLSTWFTSTGGSSMTGSWGQSLVDRSHIAHADFRSQAYSSLPLDSKPELSGFTVA